ncbi:hypothetical protein BGX34_001884, partial [Mortierella sp. NVP85]
CSQFVSGPTAGSTPDGGTAGPDYAAAGKLSLDQPRHSRVRNNDRRFGERDHRTAASLAFCIRNRSTKRDTKQWLQHQGAGQPIAVRQHIYISSICTASVHVVLRLDDPTCAAIFTITLSFPTKRGGGE